MTVWMDRWQLDCCGEPFQVGSQVCWGLWRDPDVQWLTDALGAEVVPRVDASEERHQLAQSAERTTGTVTWIAEVRCRFESAPMPDPVWSRRSKPPGSGRMTTVT
jgi:hypothetical protein